MTDHESIPAPENFLDQAEHSWTLPAYWYTDSKIFGKEKEQIFYKNWWYVGAAHQLSKPGEFLTTTVVDQEIFVIRGEDNVLRAFYQGNFRGARGVKGIENFNPSEFGLVSVRVETLIGLVFVNLDANTDALTDIAESMVKDMRAYCPGLDDLVLSRNYELQTAANWKTLVDNDLESYHSAVAHPSL
ncbi:MAG: SRPBCC family protein, partial [Pseudomonadota bacterium]|nr:SRPBCC family protein [Pseudomonadota bacterium]